jgi:hypothetical protein
VLLPPNTVPAVLVAADVQSSQASATAKPEASTASPKPKPALNAVLVEVAPQSSQRVAMAKPAALTVALPKPDLLALLLETA